MINICCCCCCCSYYYHHHYYYYYYFYYYYYYYLFQQLLRPPSRLIKTSPALFTLERVMQSFRARSQLLVSRLEDGDDVLHQMFSDDDDDYEDMDENVIHEVDNDVGKKEFASNGAVVKARYLSFLDLPFLYHK